LALPVDVDDDEERDLAGIVVAVAVSVFFTQNAVGVNPTVLKLLINF
jgi:hypothetical protein